MQKRSKVALGATAWLLAGLAACSSDTPPPVESTSSSAPVASSSAHVTTPSATPSPSPTQPPPPDPCEQVPQDLHAKAASLMVVGITDFDSALHALNLGVGGLIIPSWADPAIFTEQGRDIHALREIVGRPFTVAIDFEGGRVQRHTSVFGEFPAPRAMAQQTPPEVRAMAFDIGTRLRSHGVTVDYAPLLDVDIAGLDVVGDRSFSHDPQIAADYGIAFAHGLIDAGVTPTFKHFPGHGQASADTHLDSAVTPHLDELKQVDLKPYTQAIPAAPQASVMVGHMIVPGLGDGHTPSTINPAAYELLRTGNYPGGVPFTGVAVTDDLSGMQAIASHMGTAEAVVAAIGAGADQALWSSGANIEESIGAVVHAVETGVIPMSRIDEAAVRVQQQYIDTGLVG
ncbi:glycoside hydrolase family 3 N-terminal domain-containing protein [Corynebacterium cystitidis]|uniref:glycoside hydrolase family 3 N-terminal domain-containing protein n=1 Tax=Corynebacterium cystitidis TaxID=35757 RepID=UPI00211E514D|nr:glycoside hydrolase family 3 N-terminal domain-containing protein [Corynebacterium cystitidis]